MPPYLSTWLREIDPRLLRMSLLFAGLVLVNFIVYAVVLSPSITQRAMQETRYTELRKKHAEAVLFQKQKKALGGIVSGIPSQKDMPLVIKDIVQSARRFHLSVAAIKYDIPKRLNGEVAMLSLSFPVAGRYPDLKRFIFDIETSSRFVGIQELKLDSDHGRGKMDMKLITYVKGQ
ncbi:MAG: type 4a pilus biogenesis protein PilO [Nitrospirota bacterium]